MTVRPPKPESGEDGVGATGTPRWVKVFGAISLVVVLLVVILLFTGGGGHGPGRHTGGDGGNSVPASVTEQMLPVDSNTP